MDPSASTSTLSPAWILSRALPHLHDPVTRTLARAVLLAALGSIRVEGRDRIETLPDPAIFTLTHHGAYEALLAPTALLALRHGRPARFFVDWMYLELPLVGWLIRRIDPIVVYRKPARWRWRERRRRAGLAATKPLDRALETLRSGGSVGIYPEGRRNRHPHFLLPLRRGLGRLALRSGAPILPIGIDFPARDRIGRTPRVGQLVLRAGTPLEFRDARRDWCAARRRSPESALAAERELAPLVLEAVATELARLSRKVHLPKEVATMTRTTPATPLPIPPAPSDRSPQVAAARSSIRTARVDDDSSRAAARRILDEVYRSEKGWLEEADTEVSDAGALDTSSSWFVAFVGDEPAGAVRLQYDPSLELPREAGLELDPSVDIGRLETGGRFVEVGRLAISPAHRSRSGVVLALMRAALAEVVARGYTHLLTVVFEDDPHSPYRFHTRVLGFERIGTHRYGELRCRSRRIILTLDIARAYLRMKASRSKLLERLAGGLEEPFARLPTPGRL